MYIPPKFSLLLSNFSTKTKPPEISNKMILLGCFILGDNTNNIFSVRLDDENTISDKVIDINELRISDLKELIWIRKKNKLNVDDFDDINLWKVELSANECKVISTEEDVVGRMMEPLEMFRDENNFPASYNPTKHHVHIIIALPVPTAIQTSKFLQFFI